MLNLSNDDKFVLKKGDTVKRPAFLINTLLPRATSLFFICSLLFVVSFSSSIKAMDDTADLPVPLFSGWGIWDITRACTSDNCQTPRTTIGQKICCIETIVEQILQITCVTQSVVANLEQQITALQSCQDDICTQNAIDSNFVEEIISLSDVINNEICELATTVDVIDNASASLLEEIAEEQILNLAQSQLDLATAILNQAQINLSLLDLVLLVENSVLSQLLLSQTIEGLIANSLSISDIAINSVIPLQQSIIPQLSTQSSILSVLLPEANSIFTFVEILEPCTAILISQPTLISSAGIYCLSSDIAGQITVGTSNVQISMNGHRVYNGFNGIEVNSSVQNVTIVGPGSVGPVSNAGIQIDSGATNIVISDIEATSAGTVGFLTTSTGLTPGVSPQDIQFNRCIADNCPIGFSLNNTLIGQLNACEMVSNGTGVLYTNSSQINAQNCIAVNNTINGFSLVTSGTNTFVNCRAINTGAGSTGNAFGFVSNNGCCNIFDACLAEGTTTTTTSYTVAAGGFALLGTENCSKILNCESANNFVPSITSLVTYAFTTTSGSTVTSQQLVVNSGSAYGIYANATLQSTPTLNQINFSQILQNEFYCSAWSPDNTALVVGGTNGYGFFRPEIILYNFNPSVANIIQLGTTVVPSGGLGYTSSLNWNPNGQYMAAASLLTAISQLLVQVYSFNTYRTSAPLSLVTNLSFSNIDTSISNSVLGALPAVVSWSPNGQYLALACPFTTNGIITSVIQLYSFNALTNQLTQIPASTTDLTFSATGSMVSTSTAIMCTSVDWSPNGNYLALGIAQVFPYSNSETITAYTGGLHIYSFNPQNSTNALTPVASSSIIPVTAAKWSPDGNYIVSGGSAGAFLTTTTVLETIVTVTQIIYFNDNAITVTGAGAALPYPSTIFVPRPGAQVAISDIIVVLLGLTTSEPASLEFLLVSPHGEKLLLMNQAGDSFATSAVDIAFSSMVSAQLLTCTGQIISTNFNTFSPNYLPTDCNPGNYNFVSPAPNAPYTTSFSSLIGFDPTGTWSLYAVSTDGTPATVYGSIPSMTSTGSGSWGFALTFSLMSTVTLVITTTFEPNINIYSFQPQNATPLLQIGSTGVGNNSHNDLVFALQWSGNQQYIAAGGNFTQDVQIFSFNPQVAQVLNHISGIDLSQSDRYIPGLSWSPDGQYLAAVGTIGTSNSLALLYALTFPSFNVIKNNIVYCNSGNSASSLNAVGLSGSSLANLIINNSSYNNLTNYQFVTNIFTQAFGTVPTELQNIAIKAQEAIVNPPQLNQEMDCMLAIVDNINTVYNNMNTLDAAINLIYNVNLATTKSLADSLITKQSLLENLLVEYPQLAQIQCMEIALTNTSTFTISIAGVYCLANNVTGSITIAVSNVTLDLDGHQVINATGNAIVVNSGLTHVNILNGRVEGDSGDGIVVNSGTSQVNITDVTARNGVRGIHLLGTSYANILRCDMSANSTGFEMSSCNNITLDTCQATDNNVTGFSLISSATNVIRNCKALVNGLSSTGNSYGFVSNNGNSNIFTGCISDGLSTTTTNSSSVVAGFALTGSEMCSEIVNCESCNSVAPFTSSIVNTGTNVLAPTPYGVLLPSTLLLSNSSTAISNPATGSSPYSVSWSPDGIYIATANEGNNTVSIINVLANPSSPSTVSTISVGSTPNSLSWSPNGTYLAVANSGSNTVSIINVANTAAPTVLSTIPVGTNPLFVAWSANNQYIAVANNTSNTVSIISVAYPAAATIVSTIALSGGSSPEALAWSPVGLYLAVANTSNNNFQIYNVTNPSTPSLSSTTSTGAGTAPYSIQWSPNGQYIAVVNNTTTTLQIFNVTNLAAPFSLSTTAAGGRALNWSPDGNYIVTVAQAGQTMRIFSVTNPTAPVQLVITAVILHIPMDVKWSPDGQYIAVANSGNSTVSIFNALLFPSKNVIKNNTIYCNNAGTAAQSFGIGISGSSIANLIVNNIAYNNALNYAFIPNVFSQLLYGTNIPSPLQNIALSAATPVNRPINIYNEIPILQQEAITLSSLIDRALSFLLP